MHITDRPGAILDFRLPAQYALNFWPEIEDKGAGETNLRSITSSREILGLFDEPYVDKWSGASIIGETTQYDNLRGTRTTLIYAEPEKTRRCLTTFLFRLLITNSFFYGKVIGKTLFADY